jgi:hypothetical protein
VTNKLKDQDLFKVEIVMEAYRKEGTVIRVGDRTIPIPNSIVGTYRHHRQDESVPERRFRTDGIEVSTSEVNLQGSLLQTTFVATSKPDGTKQMVVTLANARPKDTKVDSET